MKIESAAGALLIRARETANFHASRNRTNGRTIASTHFVSRRCDAIRLIA